MATLIMSANNSRMKAMLVPREHGAWGMLLVPLATGVVVASRHDVNAIALAWFVVATMSLFWLRTPFEAWMGTSAIKAQSGQERASVLQAIVLLAAIAVASLVWLFANGFMRGLLIVGIIAASAFAAQALVKKLGRSGRMPAQIIGAIGLTSTAAGAYYAASGRLDTTAFVLWFANWLFAADQVHYVQVRIRGSRVATAAEKLKRGYAFMTAQTLLLLVLMAGAALSAISWIVVLAFVPALFRGIAWFFRGSVPLDVHKLGLSELAQAVLFGAILSVAFLV